MEKRGLFLAGLLVLICCSISSANITNATYASDGDGAFVCTPWSWTGDASAVDVNMYGDLFWGPGHAVINVFASDPTDPTLKISNSIENDSTFVWTGFTVNLFMAVPFSVTNTTLSLPAGWSLVSPGTQNAFFNGTDWEATVVYQGGPAILNDNVSSIDFGYWVKFTGSPSYVLTQEMIPVPEPSTFVLLASGVLMSGLALVSRRRNR